MTELDLWLIDSEAASRFYRAVIAVEDWVRSMAVWLRWLPLSWTIPRLKRKREAWMQEPPPLVHRGVARDEWN